MVVVLSLSLAILEATSAKPRAGYAGWEANSTSRFGIIVHFEDETLRLGNLEAG